MCRSADEAVLRELRALGGHLTHLVPVGRGRALCGFQPQAKRLRGRQMALRHGWVKSAAVMRCKKCEARRACTT